MKLLHSLNINLHNVFYMGDDINDLPVIKLVGFSAAPKDASEMVRRSVNFVSNFTGGNGAVREAIEFVLSQQIDYDFLVESYLNEKIRMTQ